MNKLRRLRSLSPEMAETLRLAGVQGIFWAAMAVGNYQTVYLQSIGFPATDFGLLNAIACAVAIFAMTFWGTVSDRIGSVRKIVILTLTLGCGLFIFVPLIPTEQSYSTLLFLILIPIINFFRVPMSPFVDNLTVRNCAEHRLNYGMVRSSGSLLFAIAGVITVNALIPAAGVPSTFWVMGIVMIPAIVLTYFCFEPQSGKRVKKSAAGAGVLLKNYAYMAFLIFAFFFQMAAAFEGNFLTYYMADIQIDTVNLGLILSVRAMMEIPFLFFIGRLRRLFENRLHRMLRGLARRRRIVDHVGDILVERIDVHVGLAVLTTIPIHEQRDDFDIARPHHLGGDRGDRIGDDLDHDFSFQRGTRRHPRRTRRRIATLRPRWGIFAIVHHVHGRKRAQRRSSCDR